jgi:hypothetical protein
MARIYRNISERILRGATLSIVKSNCQAYKALQLVTGYLIYQPFIGMSFIYLAAIEQYDRGTQPQKNKCPDRSGHFLYLQWTALPSAAAPWLT